MPRPITTRNGCATATVGMNKDKPMAKRRTDNVGELTVISSSEAEHVSPRNSAVLGKFVNDARNVFRARVP